MEQDDDKIEFILGFPVFRIKRDEEKEERHWNEFNLIPDRKRYGDLTGIEYEHKMLCRKAANGTYDDYMHLYNDVPLSEIYEAIAFKGAINY